MEKRLTRTFLGRVYRFVTARSKSKYVRDAFNNRRRNLIRTFVAPPLSLGWVLKETFLGRINSLRLFKVLFSIKRMSYGHDAEYLHDIRISDRYSTCSVGGYRRARPVKDPNLHEFEWVLIKQGVDLDWDGLQAVDIGAAEGFFTLQAARLGASVNVIQPPGDFRPRLETLRDYLGFRSQINVMEGTYPADGGGLVANADIVLCLGLLYHLNNLVEGLGPMVKSKGTIVIEGMFLPDDYPLGDDGIAVGFDPITHLNKERICSRWLTGYLSQQGFDVQWLKDWQDFVERPGELQHEPTRKLMVAKWSPTLKPDGATN